MKRRIHIPVHEQQLWLSQVLRGHYGYFSVVGNHSSMKAFFKGVKSIWFKVFKALRRRQQKAKMTWARFLNVLTMFPLRVFWGTMPVMASEVADPHHPLLIATTRSLGGGLALLLLFRKLPPKAWYLRVLVLGTVNIASVFALFFISAARVPGSIIAILMALSPFWATLLA